MERARRGPRRGVPQGHRGPLGGAAAADAAHSRARPPARSGSARAIELAGLTDLTLLEQAALLRRAQCSSRELVDAHLARIDKLDGKLHAFVEVYAAEARALADAADQARKARLPLGPLHGLPIALKDLCDIAGRIGTVGSKMWAARIAERTSATAARLLAAGMIPLGKLHMVEFAFGAWGTNPLMGTPWNPWDLKRQRVPGGSSSGTGVAVAAGLAPAGIGSDTGGSVRIPAAFNGLFGLKTTFGRISLEGTGLLSWTLDTIGPLARSADDCAELLRVLADDGAPDLPAELAPGRLARRRLALPDRAQLPPFMHPAVLAAWTDAAKRLEQLGAEIVPVRLPDWYFDLGRQVGMIIASEAFDLHRAHIEDRSQAINDAVRERVLAAAKLAPGEYAGMLRVMAERRREFQAWFEGFDAFILPTTAVPALPLDEIDEQAPIPAYLTRAVNYLGLCALAMPAGLHEGLPLSAQVIGRPHAERTILEIGKAYQEDTGHHKLRPQLG
jgi:aspartyl-tRNA(Asn)/glutamyl-tRNA(Gln) amidotransferase subunit A